MCRSEKDGDNNQLTTGRQQRRHHTVAVALRRRRIQSRPFTLFPSGNRSIVSRSSQTFTLKLLSPQVDCAKKILLSRLVYYSLQRFAEYSVDAISNI